MLITLTKPHMQNKFLIYFIFRWKYLTVRLKRANFRVDNMLYDKQRNFAAASCQPAPIHELRFSLNWLQLSKSERKLLDFSSYDDNDHQQDFDFQDDASCTSSLMSTATTVTTSDDSNGRRVDHSQNNNDKRLDNNNQNNNAYENGESTRNPLFKWLFSVIAVKVRSVHLETAMYWHVFHIYF